MRTLKKYGKIWWIMSRNALSAAIYSKLSFLIFLLGKVVRFSFFVLFLFYLVEGTGNLAGYDINQTIFIFLTFNVIDIVGQFLFREVYRFKPLILSGDFDLILVRPTSSLFRGLMGGADFIDLFTIPILFVVLYFVGMNFHPQVGDVLIYLLLLINGLMITAAFHIFILGLYVRFLELDYVLWLYRDLLNLGKLPVGVYKQPLRDILVYLVPVATMITVPARAMMGLVSFWGVIVSILIGTVGILVSMRFWKYALRYYTSASS